MPKLIAIIGGLTAIPGETDQQKARFVEELKSVAREFGRQLAVAKSEMAVYTSHANSIERYVVEGYLEKGGAGDNSIRVLYGGSAEIDFPRKDEYKHVFDWQADAHEDWENSFYLSLDRVDGMLILNGAKSALIAGLFGITQSKPIVALPSSEGSAKKLWVLLEKSDLLTHEDHSFLGRPASTWDANAIARAITLFDKQHERLGERLRKQAGAMDAAKQAEELRARKEAEALEAEEKNSLYSVVTGICLLVMSLLLIVLTLIKAIPWVFLLGCCLFLGPMIAGGAGATFRNINDGEKARGSTRSRPLFKKLALGLGAGAIASALAFLPHVLADTHLPQGVEFSSKQKDEVQRDQFNALTPWAIITGFIAGFAADQFYQKLQDVKLGSVEFPKH